MDFLHIYILILFGIFGLCLGSFYNVVILRSLSGESIVFPPSKCPKCGQRLKPRHNIPVLSYIFLRGKCAFCGEKISLQYPVVELITMMLFISSYIKFGLTVKTFFVLFWISCFIIMTVTDLKKQLVDCNIAIAAAISGAIFGFVTEGTAGLLNSAEGMAAGALILILVTYIGLALAKTETMGEADKYVSGALGGIFGFSGIFAVLLYALAASMVYIIPVYLIEQYRNKNKMTCLLAVIFVLSIIVYKAINEYSLIIVVMSGILFALSVLKTIKSERHYLPFVPFLSAGGLYYLFFVF